MSSIKSCPGFVECCHPLSHQSIVEHKNKKQYNNKDNLMLDIYLQSQIDIITQEQLLDDYNKVEVKSIIPLDLLNSDDLIIAPTTISKSPCCSFDDYTSDKSALIMKGLSMRGKLIPYVFNHPVSQSTKNEKMRKKNRYSIKSIFSPTEEEGLVAFRYPKTVDVHTLRSITIRLLIGLSPPYLKQKQ